MKIFLEDFIKLIQDFSGVLWLMIEILMPLHAFIYKEVQDKIQIEPVSEKDGRHSVREAADEPPVPDSTARR